MRQNPFSLYDFLGYVIPGALTLMLINFFHDLNGLESINGVYQEILKQLSNTKTNSNLSLLEETAVFVVLAYIVGHIVAYLSSLTVEQYLIWVYGYPSEFLLKKEPAWHYLRVGQYEEDEEGFKLPNKCSQWLNLTWRVLIGLFLFPLSICTFIFGKVLNGKTFFVKPLDEMLKKAIEVKRKMLTVELGLEYQDKKEGDNQPGENSKIQGDFHRVIYHYEYEKQNNHHNKMDNYVALYGFLRAMTFISNCVTVWITYKYIRPTIHWGWSIDWSLIRLWGCCILLTYIFFMAFIKFYRRFTLESFMCLIVDTTITPQKANTN